MNQKPAKEVFRGHLEECVQHLAVQLLRKTPKGSHESTQAKQPIADFCGVSVKSVTRWLQDAESLPGGETLIRLMCFLDMLGYQVLELERMPKARRNFAELIGFNILPGQQAADLIGYAKPSTLYLVLLANQSTTKDKETNMWTEWKSRKEQLEARKKYWSDRHIGVLLGLPATTSLANRRCDAVANVMKGLLSLLDAEQFDVLAEDDLEDQKEAIGTVLDLSDELQAKLSDLRTKLAERIAANGGN